MSQPPKFTRREFNNKASRYLGVAAVAAATPALWSCTSDEEPTAFEDPAADQGTPAAEAPAPSGPTEIKMVDTNSPAAKALNYCENANSPEPQCPARAAADKQGQFCTTCLFFNLDSARTVDGGKIEDIETQRDIAIAECQLLPGQGFVAGPGWCQSWAKRQG